MTNPTARHYTPQASGRARMARIEREGYAARRAGERRRLRGMPYAPLSSCVRLDDLAEQIDGWIGARTDALAMDRAHMARGNANDAHRRFMLFHLASQSVRARIGARFAIDSPWSMFAAQSGYTHAMCAASDDHSRASAVAA